MKIKESDLKRLIQESMQELSLEALEQELDEVAPGIEQDILQGPGMNKKKSAGASGWSRDAISAINPTKAPGSNLRGSDTQKALAGLGRMAQGEEDAMVYEQEEEELEEGWGVPGGIGGTNPRSTDLARKARGGGGGGIRYMDQFRALIAAASRGNQEAMKNAESMAKVNPGNEEMQGALKQARLGAKKSDWNQFFANNPVTTNSEGKVWFKPYRIEHAPGFDGRTIRPNWSNKQKDDDDVALAYDPDDPANQDPKVGPTEARFRRMISSLIQEELQQSRSNKASERYVRNLVREALSKKNS